MLKQVSLVYKLKLMVQPPSGGCVLKPIDCKRGNNSNLQPPSGGCVLKLAKQYQEKDPTKQPPSGGCVLKHS